MGTRTRALLPGLLGMLLSVGCRLPPTATVHASPVPQVAQVQASPAPTQEGISLGVQEVQTAEAAVESIPRGLPQPLTGPEIQALLGRLPPLQAEPGDRQAFALRPRSLPAPITGHTVRSSFPPKESSLPPDLSPTGPLEVLRHGPEGNVDMAPELSVTFNQPMVPLSSLAVVDKLLPVKLDPQPDGHWHWIGTRTLQFVPTHRFPMATTYHVTVPAGTASVTHNTLPRTVDWTFSTPPLTLVRGTPEDGPVNLHPIFVMVLNQAIHSDDVLNFVKLTAGPSKVAVVAATDEDLRSDEGARSLVADAAKNRWIAFKAATPLTPDTRYQVALQPGAPSAEGPQLTQAPQTFGFHTYSRMRVQTWWPTDPQPPGSGWVIEFNNPIDTHVFKPQMVHVSPEVPGLRLTANGSALSLTGRVKGRTTYRVTLDPSLPDVFGQTLGASPPLDFVVGPVPPSFTAQGGPFVVLDPHGKPTWSIYSTNEPRLKVRLYAVSVADWAAFLKFQETWQSDKPSPMPGRLLDERMVQPVGAPDDLTETRLDLSPALSHGLGQVVVVVDTPDQPKNIWEWQRVMAWIQVTHLGLDAVADHQKMIGWVSSLADGTPVPDVQLSLDAPTSTTTASTDANGLATLPLPGSIARLLVARHGDDLAFLPQNTSWYSDSGWYRRAPVDTLRWFLFDDRNLYRPGEDVHVKGWVRVQGGGQHGDIQPAPVTTVHYSLNDSRGNKVLQGTAPVDPMGGFSLGIKLARTMNLGNATLLLDTPAPGLGGASTSHTFQVQEFRRPEFEVGATAEAGPFVMGGHGHVALDAHYYAGGGLPNADVTWNVTATPAYYAPPDTEGYSFGSWVPWWENKSLDFEDERSSPEGAGYQKTFHGHTDARGQETLDIHFDRGQGPHPLSVSAEGSVMDVNRQAWTATATLLVHPAAVYVGVKSDRSFVQQGDPIEVDTLVTDLDGKRVAGRPVQLHLARLEWVLHEGRYQQQEVDPQNQAVSSAASSVRATFKTTEGGQYRLQATVTDAQGRTNESDLTVYVAGGKEPPARGLEQQKVTLIPDRKTYRGGDVAALLVQAPFVPAHGLLTLSRSGILETRPFTMDSATTTLKIPIQDWYLPGITVQVDLVGEAPRTDDDGRADPKLGTRPAYATGVLGLTMPLSSRALKLTVTPEKAALAPGAQTWLDVSLTAPGGNGVAGQVALVVVDEAILALSRYDVSDPLGFFYSGRDGETSGWHSRASVLLANPQDLEKPSARPEETGKNKDELKEATTIVHRGAPGSPPEVPAPMAKAADASIANPEPQIQMRTNMNALALFAASVKTDARGHARVAFKLPDNLTRYRIMAVATANDKLFGQARGALVARLPLMVRPSAPRFLNFGDRFDLPVVLQNQTDAPMTVSVAVRASNLQLPSGAGQKVTVPANDRVEVRFPASAVEAGTVRIQMAGVSGRASDAATITLPCWTPATTEAFAVYGTVDEGGIRQPVAPPPDVFPHFGGLEVTTSSTALASLTDALLYLEAYRFECAEQVSSRVLGVAALRDVLTAFKAEGLPTAEQMRKAMDRDIEKLASLQNEDGGFGFWHRGEESWPYISIHVTHALQVARLKGFQVPDKVLTAAQAYLAHIEAHIPAWYSIECRRALIAYALNVRTLMGDVDAPRARRLVDEAGVDHLSVEAQAWLLAVLTHDPGSSTAQVQQIRRYLDNHTRETAGDAHFTTSYSDGAEVLLASDRRADAVVLAALIEDQPQSDLIPKLVHGLLDHRTRGRWENTQENVFVLLALDSYFHRYESITPDYVARVWLGDQYAGDHAFKGHTTERSEVDVPMHWLADHPGVQDLILAKTGPGRLYYRLGMSYAPRNLKMPAADYGFGVQRTYQAIDNPTDVRQDADGTWHIKAGARVRIHLSMVAQSRRYHVALVDPLPAGLEAMNPELAVTGTVPRQPSSGNRYGWWWSSTWFEHENLRDERAEAFTSLLWEGVYSYDYVARATTPGTFVVPPTKAEEMYHPETFGRSASDRVVVQ